jgi:hypothetical protein
MSKSANLSLAARKGHKDNRYFRITEEAALKLQAQIARQGVKTVIVPKPDRGKGFYVLITP